MRDDRMFALPLLSWAFDIHIDFGFVSVHMAFLFFQRLPVCVRAGYVDVCLLACLSVCIFVTALGCV